MLTTRTKRLMVNTAKKICQNNKLSHFYFAQSLGKRKHYLVGYGQEDFVPAEHMVLSKDLVVFWQGALSEEAGVAIKRDCASIADIAERELETFQDGL